MNKDYTDISRCQCGAITIIIGGKEYSMTAATFKKRYGIKRLLKINNVFINCNHCVNHWGIDLCACGSGKPVDDCDEKTDVCGKPMQSIEDGKIKTSGKGAWI